MDREIKYEINIRKQNDFHDLQRSLIEKGCEWLSRERELTGIAYNHMIDELSESGSIFIHVWIRKGTEELRFISWSSNKVLGSGIDNVDLHEDFKSCTFEEYMNLSTGLNDLNNPEIFSII